MGTILDFLKHIPDAATSPLAFVAYCLALGAWVLQQWFATKPQRDAKAILKSFKDDNTRLAAIGEIFNEPPPKGLRGNEAILEWVKTRSTEKKRVLIVVAWLATLVAVLVFVVAVKNASGSARRISIRLHRTAGIHSPCPLPLEARLAISANFRQLDKVDIADCVTNLVVRSFEKGFATVSLVDSGPYKLFDTGHQYALTSDQWDVYIQGPLQITLFNYSGECPDLSRTLDTFETLIRSKANSLRGMFPLSDSRFDYLSRLSVVRTGDAFRLDAGAAHDYWQQTDSLQLLVGLCIPAAKGEVMRSQIFFGDLKGRLPSESFLADLTVSPNEFGNNRDIHTASMLYALAQEARSRQLEQDLVIEYLQEARTIAGQVTVGSGKQLKDAINASLSDADAPKPMALPK